VSFSAQSFANFFLCSQDSTFGHATVCACFPPKVHDGTPDSAVPDLFLAYRYNKLRVDAEGHSNASVRVE